ncbi:MAG: redoxin domain-containing protein [Gemmatimonadota bacterium]|nr:redoxin domain-containing protein [Gemmatimonadota bacterium]
MSASELLAVGSAAPDFRAQASDGSTYALADLLAPGSSGAHGVALFFYPGNDTPG